MKSLVFLTTILACALAAPSPTDNNNEVNIEGNTFNRVMKYISPCVDNEDAFTCMAIKGISAINRAARAQMVTTILPGIVFTRRSDASVRFGKALSENELTDSVNLEKSDRVKRLIDLALESISNFLSSHYLQLSVPETNLGRALEEGRKKHKLKKLAPIILGVLTKSVAFLPFIIGAVALLAIKAAVVSKLALILALIAAGRNFFSGASGGLSFLGKLANSGSSIFSGSSGSTSYSQPWSAGSGSGYSGYSSGSTYRSFEENDGQNLAYSAHNHSS